MSAATPQTSDHPGATVVGSRVALTCLGADGVGALLREDTETLHALTGLHWSDEPLPDLVDHLEAIHAALVRTPTDAPWWTWGIVRRDDDHASGAVGLNGPADNDGIVWIGYTLYPGARGRGIATDAVETLIGWAFEDDAVRAVLASIAPGNLKSVAVARRAGLRFHKRGETMDIYRQTRGQWDAQQ